MAVGVRHERADMLGKILKVLAAFLMPGGAVVLAAALVLKTGLVLPYYEALARVVPLGVLLVSIYLGLRFRRGRIVWASLILILAESVYHHLVWAETGGAYSARTVSDATALLIPVNLGLIALLPERAILHPRNLRVAIIVVAEVFAVMAVSRSAWDVSPLLGATLVDADWIRALGLPQPALIAFVVCGVLLIVHFFLNPGPSRGAYVWALAASWGALGMLSEGDGASLLLSSGVAALILSEAESSHMMAFRDELTCLPGRRALMAHLDGLTDIYVAVMVDVDRFKKFNDTYGHDIGDQVLRMVASRLERAGSGGRAYRYGGEEFTLLYPGCLLDEVMPRLESLRAAIEESGFNLRHSDRPARRPEDPSRAPRSEGKVRVTVSMGAAQGNARSDEDPHAVLKDADQALYKAKRAGRNKVRQAG